MNKINERINRIKEVVKKRKVIVIIAIILFFVILIFMAFSLKNNQMSKLFNITNKYIDEQTEDKLTEKQARELTETIQDILDENEICDESELDERIKAIQDKFRNELKDKSYLTSEEKDKIVNNLDKFIQNEYRAYNKEVSNRLSGFEKLFNELETSISKKADKDAVSAVEERTVTLIAVNGELKKADIDLYNQINYLNSRLSSLNNTQDNFSEEFNNRVSETVKEFNILLNEIKKDTTKDYTEKLEELRSEVDQYVIDINKTITDMNVNVEESNKQVHNSIANLKDETSISMEALNNKTELSITEVKNNTDVALGNLSNYLTNMISNLDSILKEQIYQNGLGILGLKEAVQINQESIGKINTIATENAKSIQEVNVQVSDNKNSITDMKAQLNDCFQSVSNGKALLASTLTDKGINTISDATFGEINNNILNLYTAAFTAGVDSVAGINADVEYEYHYHNGTAEKGGGCYSIANIHHHTGSSSSGGGCYTTPKYDISYIYPSCSGGWIKDTNSWGDKDGNRDRRYRGWCSVCGYYYASYSEWSKYPSEAGPTHTSLKATEVKTLSGYSLACGHSEGELLGYETGCGMIDGQIISAKINMSNTKTKTANILTSLNSLFDMEVEAQEHNDNKNEPIGTESETKEAEDMEQYGESEQVVNDEIVDTEEIGTEEISTEEIDIEERVIEEGNENIEQ